MPENITVLPSDTPITAYDLTSSSKAVGITYNGTIGLELATQGLPVLVAGRCHYTDAKIIYPIQTKEHYLYTLNDTTQLVDFTQKNLMQIKKYAYFYFCKTPIKIPFFRHNKWATIDWKQVRDINKLLDENRKITKMAQKMVIHEDIVNQTPHL